ncbi:MAG TPA: efflux RND transporter periplasmic adaptor subunit [Planctomycetia bacterium]|nr:efflux RND transporter periplasmic adaptor subunit [Planctomycetia bacterium]
MTKKTQGMIAAALVALAAGGYFGWRTWMAQNGTMILPATVEIQEVRLGSKIGGRVAETLVAEGQVVEAQTELVRFEAPELEAQRAQIEARLRAAEAAYSKAQSGLRQEERDAAAAASKSAAAKATMMGKGYREEERKRWAAELETARANLVMAEREFARVEPLAKRGAANRAEFDIAKSNLESARGRRDAALAVNSMYEAGYREEERDESKWEAARLEALHRMAEAGNRAEDRAIAQYQALELAGKLKEIDANLREASVIAPERAVVQVLAVRKGDLVPAGQAAVRVLRADDLWVKAYVPETDLGAVRLHQQVKVRVDAYPERNFKGTVMHISSISEFTPRNVQSVDQRRHQVFGIKVKVEDPEGVFKAGMAAEVELEKSAAEK